MENAVEEIKKETAPAREIGVITLEIKELCRQAQVTALMYIVEIGRRLCEAKASLPYGKFGEWLKNEVHFSQSAAGDYMKLFEEYGSSQITLFGASVDSQTFANLPYTKALQLLAIPREEREEFALEVDAENLSVRQLKAAIAERKKAEEERDEARKIAEVQQKMKEELAKKLSDAESAAKEALLKADEAEKYKNQLDEALSGSDDLKRRLADAEKSLKAAMDNADRLKKQLKEAESDPEIPAEKLEKLRAELTAAVKKETEAASAKALEEARRNSEAADAMVLAAKLAEKDALERLAEAEKRLKIARPEVASFKALFDSMQETASKLRTMIEKLRSEDPETAGRLSSALRSFASSLGEL